MIERNMFRLVCAKVNEVLEDCTLTAGQITERLVGLLQPLAYLPEQSAYCLGCALLPRGYHVQSSVKYLS